MSDLGSGRRKLVREKGCPYCRGYSSELELERIIGLAYDFECCPNCGNVEIESHYCPKCKERFACPYEGYFFGEYLKKLVSGERLGDTVALTNMEDASSSVDGRNKHSTLSRKAYGGQSSSPLNEDKYYVKKRRWRV